MTTPITLDRLNAIIDAFNAHDADAVAGFFASDGVMLLPAGKEPVGTTLDGPAAIRAALTTRFTASPDIQWVDGKNWLFGHKALSEWRVVGTAPDGSAINTIGCDLWEFGDDGLIVKKDTYYKQKA